MGGPDAPRPTRRVRVVAALIGHPADPDRILVQQRLPGGSRGLLWEFPGGKVESGETDEAALIRECREELGVELFVGRKVWETSHAYTDLAVDLVLYRASITRGEPRNLGAHDLRYASATQMKALPFCEADLPLIDLLVEGALPR